MLREQKGGVREGWGEVWSLKSKSSQATALSVDREGEEGAYRKNVGRSPVSGAAERSGGWRT